MSTARSWFVVLVSLATGALRTIVLAQPPGPTGSEFQVNAYTTSHQSASAAAMAIDGDFVVVWTGGYDQDGSGSGVSRDAHVFTLDRSFCSRAYALLARMEERYGITVERATRARHFEQQAVTTETGCGSATRTHAAACARCSRSSGKLAGLDAWVTGVQPEQGAARAKARKVAWDAAPIVEGRPAGRLGEKRRLALHHERDLPYNPLHDQGYASISCTRCTRPEPGAKDAGQATTKPSAGCTADRRVAFADMDVLTAFDAERIEADRAKGHPFWLDLDEPPAEEIEGRRDAGAAPAGDRGHARVRPAAEGRRLRDHVLIVFYTARLGDERRRPSRSRSTSTSPRTTCSTVRREHAWPLDELRERILRGRPRRGIPSTEVFDTLTDAYYPVIERSRSGWTSSRARC